MKSIIQSEHKCYFCKIQGQLDKHHCIYGTAGRRKADEDGLTVYLCRSCHRNLHDHGYGELVLKQMAQYTWMKYYGKTKEDWIRRYDKSYIP